MYKKEKKWVLQKIKKGNEEADDSHSIWKLFNRV